MAVPLNPANKVTLVRMLLIPVFLVVLLGEWPNWLPAPPMFNALQPWLAAVVFTLVAATDAVDGYLARSRNEVTTFGKLIDPLADKLLVTAALVALVDLDRLPGWIAIVIISRELIVTGLRMVAVAEGKVIAAAPSGKLKTVLQIMAIVGFIIKDSSLIEDMIGETGMLAFTTLSWAVMAAALVMTVYSLAVYVYHARDVITGPWNPE